MGVFFPLEIEVINRTNTVISSFNEAVNDVKYKHTKPPLVGEHAFPLFFASRLTFITIRFDICNLLYLFNWF